MYVKELLYKYKSLIIIILLFLVAFTVRVEAVNIGGVSDDMKSFYQDSSGLPYFSEMDSYYNIRLTSDLLDHGYLGDKFNGSQWDLHSSYPPGKSANYPPLIAYLAAIGFIIANLFAKVPLAYVCFWMGAFIASLAVMPAYFLVKKITNIYGGIVAGLLVGLAPAYIGHTHAGFFDTDMFGMVIPLLIALFFILSLSADNFRKRTVYASLAAFSMLLFALAWQGWWYIYYLIIASMVIYLLVTNYIFPLKPRKSTDVLKGRLDWFNNKPDFFTFAVFMVLSIILMSIFLGVIGFLWALTEPIHVDQIQATVQTTSYPNVYLTVGELRPTDMDDVVGGVGGLLPFLFGFLGMVALCWKLKPKKEKKEIVEEKTRKPRRRGRSNHRKEENKEYKADKVIIKSDVGYEKSNYIFYIILFAIWLLITIYAMTKGVRFVANFALPITLTAGIFVGLLYDYIKERIPNTSYQTMVMAIIIVVVAFSPLTMSYNQTSHTIPGTDDGMINSLEWVKNNTSPDTVITSWWDFGHLFTFVADRPVTFDGSSQNTPRAYCVGKALSTNNETLSVGIIRMLASTGDTATYLLANYTQSSGKSADILNNILGVDKETAITLMTANYGLTSEQAQNVVMYTHPTNPAPDILITSHDMIEKAGAWAMLGNWNFTTNQAKEYLSSRVELGGVTVNNKILFTGINIHTRVAVAAQDNGTSISAGVLNTAKIANQDANKILNQISTELTTGNGSLIMFPNKLTVVNNGNVTQTTVSNSSKFSIILFQQNNKYESFIISKELDDSIFMKLYIFGGEGLTHFKQLYKETGVVVWSVNY